MRRSGGLAAFACLLNVSIAAAQGSPEAPPPVEAPTEAPPPVETPPVEPAVETPAPVEAPPATPPPAAPPPAAPPPAPPPGYVPPAYGQPGSPPPPAYGPPPQHPPPAAMPAPQGVRLHDSFYLRMGLGVGYGNVKSKGSAGGSDLEITFKGFGPVYELLLGGTPGGGFVIGGGFVGQDISNPEIEVTIDSGGSASGNAPDSALGVGVVGPFVDWFIDPTAGAHVGLLGGIGLIGVQDEKGDSAQGFGAALFGGYDFWVGDQWSLGPEARIVYVNASRDSGTGPLSSSFDDNALSFQLLFSALYH